MLSATAISLLFLFPSLVHSYSWNFKSPPRQCSDLTVTVSGSDGKPPYRILIIPFGPPPFTNNTEVRRIVDQDFGGADKTEVTFKLNFPAFSQLVAVVRRLSFISYGISSLTSRTGTYDRLSVFSSRALYSACPITCTHSLTDILSRSAIALDLVPVEPVSLHRSLNPPTNLAMTHQKM